MNVHLAAGMRDALLAHALREAPLEACGLLGGAGDALVRYVPCANALRSPSRYAIAPEEILAALQEFAAEGLALRGIFHSHPAGPASPSARDVREAAYPETAYLIAAPRTRELRAFRLAQGAFCEVQVRVQE